MAAILEEFTIELTAGTFRAAGEFEHVNNCPMARQIDKFFGHHESVAMLYSYCDVNGMMYTASVPYTYDNYLYDASVVANIEIPQNHVLRTIKFTLDATDSNRR